MATLRFQKVVGSLPETLDPDTLYLVRTGAGFELYMSDATGSIAYPVNAPTAVAALQIAYPKRSDTPKIVGDATGADLTTNGLTPLRLYFIPLVVPRDVNLTGLRISVTTAASGTASIGIYSNTVVNGEDAPGSLLASVTDFDLGTTGDKTGALNYTLNAGTLYWVSMIASAYAAIRHLTSSNHGSVLGREVNSSSVITYLYASISNVMLPTTAPTTLTAVAGWGAPAIYLLE
jgi:hypothetical protein